MCAHVRTHVLICVGVPVCAGIHTHMEAQADVRNLPHYSSTLFTEAGVSQPHSEVEYMASHTTQLVFQTCSVV